MYKTLALVYASAVYAITLLACISESAVKPSGREAVTVPPKGEESAASIKTTPTISTTVGIEMIASQEVERPSKGNPKLESSLNQLVEAYRQGGIVEAQAFAMSHNMVFQGDRVQVTIVTTEEAVGDVRCAVEAVGGEYQTHYRNLVQALVPIGELEVLAQRPDVQIIREPRRPTLL